MKKLLLLAIALVLFACKKDQPPVYNSDVEIPTDSIPKPQPKVNLDIIPGKSIGNIALEETVDSLAFLGQPDLSDAAMGKAWLTWYSTNSKRVNGKSELNIYTTYKDNEMKEKVVRQIRVTSPDFKTTEDLGTGKSFEAISTALAELDFLGSFRKPGSDNTVELYDATNSGIAFEIENTGSEKICIAVIVHTPGRKVTEEYITFHPDLVKTNGIQ